MSRWIDKNSVLELPRNRPFWRRPLPTGSATGGAQPLTADQYTIFRTLDPISGTGDWYRRVQASAHRDPLHASRHKALANTNQEQDEMCLIVVRCSVFRFRAS